MKNYPVIEVATRSGKVMYAFKDDSITTAIQEKGEYDGNTLDSLREVLALVQPDTTLDVGANIGNHALVLAGLSRKLIAFEPVPFIFDLLKRNVEVNRLDNVAVVNAGLSDAPMRRDIFVPDHGNLGCSSLESMDSTGSKIEIKTLIGDDYLVEHHPLDKIDFIKMDVEGHEPSALAGLKNTILKCQPLLLIEYKNEKTMKMFKDKDYFESIFAGYRIFSLSSTASKKVYRRSISGAVKRSIAKYFNRTWCLSAFDPSLNYSNIYLVPQRYLSLFNTFKYLAK